MKKEVSKIQKAKETSTPQDGVLEPCRSDGCSEKARDSFSEFEVYLPTPFVS